jgi:general secretion pathway protein L
MAEWFLLKIAREPDLDATFMVADESGRVVTPAQSGPLAQGASLATGRRACVLVPAAEVLLTEADVPVKSGTKLQQVVPYALEEQLAEDIDRLHFAIGRRAPDSSGVPTAVVSRALLERWLEALKAQAIALEAMYVDAELLPDNPGQAVALLEGDDALLRTPGSLPVVLPVDSLADALMSTGEASPEPRGLVLYATPAEWERHRSGIESVRERFESVKVQLLAGGALPLFAQQLPGTTAINLLQGAYAPKSALATGWRAWRAAALLAIALFGLHVVGKAVELGSLRRVERGIEQSMEQTFRQAMPGEQSAVDARRRMDQRLQALRGGASSSGLLAALGALAQARANIPGATVQSLSYREGALDLRMVAPDAETLDRLSQSLRGAGWQADLTSGNATEAGYEGRLQIRARGAS